MITATSDASKKVTYGELVGGKKLSLALNPNAKRKDPRSWTVLGTSVPRVDLPALVTGQFQFVHNVRVPGMVHGAVVRPPEVGATLVSVDEHTVSGLPGFIKVVVKKNFVGVVFEKPWQAIQAAARLKPAWAPGTGVTPQREFYDALRKHEPDHILLRATRQDAAHQLADLKRLGDLLRRAKGRIDYRRLDRISPLAVPVLLEIGKERVLDGTAEDELLDIAAQELIEEATRLS